MPSCALGTDQIICALGVPGRGICGCLLTRHAISALICEAATEAGVGLDRVRFERTVRRRAADPAAFPPGTWTASFAAPVMPVAAMSRAGTVTLSWYGPRIGDVVAGFWNGAGIAN